MTQGVIQSCLQMDVRQFNTSLTAGTKRLEQFGEAAERIFTRLNQIATTAQSTFANLKLPDLKPNITVNVQNSGLAIYRADADSASFSIAGLGDATGRSSFIARCLVPSRRWPSAPPLLPW